MPALGFRSEFVPAVENGIADREDRMRPYPNVAPKTQTIRAERRDGRKPCEPRGDLKLYTGMRTKHCRLLGEVRVRTVQRIAIDSDGDVEIDGVYRGAAAKGRLAQLDGFISWGELVRWFEKVHGLPFVGWVIRW